MNVQRAVEVLFQEFPAQQAEGWDRVGLSVGDPEASVTAALCALDPTPDTVAQAVRAGCNLLVTHHPAFLDPPFPITPSPRTSSLAGATVAAALRAGVSLVAMHTNLDRSAPALELPSQLTGLAYQGPLDAEGYGALLDSGDLSPAALADRFAQAYGAPATLWEAAEAKPGPVAFCSGSGGVAADAAVLCGCRLLVTGELSYHRCLDLRARGVSVLLLGHDASELPYAPLLAKTLRRLCPGLSVTEALEPRPWDLCVPAPDRREL